MLKVERDEKRKPIDKTVKYKITGMSENEFFTLCKGLYSLQDETAKNLLEIFEAVGEFSTKDII